MSTMTRAQAVAGLARLGPSLAAAERTADAASRRAHTLATAKRGRDTQKKAAAAQAVAEAAFHELLALKVAAQPYYLALTAEQNPTQEPAAA